jgi:hypothetical protein
MDCFEEADAPMKVTLRGRLGGSLHGILASDTCWFLNSATNQITIHDLTPSRSYTISIKLQMWSGMTAALSSPDSSITCTTQEVSLAPPAPYRPVVQRLSSECVLITALSMPCRSETNTQPKRKASAGRRVDEDDYDGVYACSEAFVLQVREGVLGDSNKENEWRTITNIEYACSHSTAPEVVSQLERRRVDIVKGKVYNFVSPRCLFSLFVCVCIVGVYGLNLCMFIYVHVCIGVCSWCV